MNLQEAKQLLKKKGFTVIKENNSLTYTAQDIFEEMYDRRYQYFEDTDSTYTSLNEWFVHGYNNDISMEELGKQAVESDGESSIADDQLAYEEGAEFSKCQTDDEVQDLLAEYTNDQHWNEAKHLLKKKGFTVIKEKFTDEETAKINSEKQQLLFDELTAVKNEFTEDEAELIGINAILSNIKYGHVKYEKGETGIIIYNKDYRENPELFKKFTEIAEAHGFETEFSHGYRGVFVRVSWLF